MISPDEVLSRIEIYADDTTLYSADLQALMVLASTMGNVPLSLRILYLPNMSLLEALTFLSRCLVIQLILLCAGLSFINHTFFLTQSALWNLLLCSQLISVISPAY